MTNFGINNLFNEELNPDSYIKELDLRLQLIDKEIVRLIEAKKRYEQELEKLKTELNQKSTTK